MQSASTEGTDDGFWRWCQHCPCRLPLPPRRSVAPLRKRVARCAGRATAGRAVGGFRALAASTLPPVALALWAQGRLTAWATDLQATLLAARRVHRAQRRTREHGDPVREATASNSRQERHPIQCERDVAVQTHARVALPAISCNSHLARQIRDGSMAKLCTQKCPLILRTRTQESGRRRLLSSVPRTACITSWASSPTRPRIFPISSERSCLPSPSDPPRSAATSPVLAAAQRSTSTAVGSETPAHGAAVLAHEPGAGGQVLPAVVTSNRRRMDRATPGCRAMRPRRTSICIIWLTVGAETRKCRCMSDSAGALPERSMYFAMSARYSS